VEILLNYPVEVFQIKSHSGGHRCAASPTPVGIENVFKISGIFKEPYMIPAQKVYLFGGGDGRVKPLYICVLSF
jgi:hypothetical protein